MEEGECFICGDPVCEEELLETIGLNSIRDLSKSFANLFRITSSNTELVVAVAAPLPPIFQYESEQFEDAPLCYKCINRILDAHNLINQINLLQIKLKAIRYDVHSLMKKKETTDLAEDQGHFIEAGNVQPSKFQQLRKDIVKSLNSNKLSSSSRGTIGALSAKIEVVETNSTDNKNTGLDEDVGDDQKLIYGFIKNDTPAPVQKRTSDRIRVKTPKYAEFSELMITQEPEIPTDSSDNDCGQQDDYEAILPDDNINTCSENRSRKPEKEKKTYRVHRKYKPDEDPLAGKLTCPHKRCNTVYFSSEFSLNAHIKRIHEGVKKPFSCDICGKSYQYPVFLKEHQLSHTGEDNFPCRYCNKILKSGKSRRIHEKTHLEGGKPFACLHDQCDRSFANKQHLQSHLISHETDTKYECEECLKVFSRERSLQLHKRLHENPESSQCPTCHKKFSTDTSLRIHQELHAPRTKPRICTQCPFQCFLRRDMKRHIQTCHKVKPIFECEICGRQVSTKKILNSHIRTHSTEKAFNCSICKKAFREETCKRRHEALHYKQTLVCHVCGKTFATQSYLTQHLKTHERLTKKKVGQEMVTTEIDFITEEVKDGNDDEDEFDDEDDFEEVEEEIVGSEDESQTGTMAEQFTYAELQDPQGEIQFVQVVEMSE